MSCTASYQNLFDEVVKVAKSYSMADFLNGFTPELVNILLTNHIGKIEKADSYESTIQLISESLSTHIGVQMKVENFITKEQDRQTLYDIFKTWRIKLLAEENVL